MSQIQAMQAPYFPTSGADPVAAARRLGPTVVILLGARAAFPILRRAVMAAMPRDYGTIRTAASVLSGIASVLGLVAFIFFLIWLYRTVVALRARGEATRFSPGFTVGGWFIPFANFALPPMAIADAWRRITRSGAGLIGAWWAAYLLFIVVDGVNGVMMNSHGISFKPWLIQSVSWLGLLSTMGAYGLWAYLVRRMSQELV